MGKDVLLVAIMPPRSFVRVQGRGSFRVAPALKKFSGIARQRGCLEMVIDMQDCAGLDSTFMGVVAGIAMRLRKQTPPGQTFVVNLDSKNAGLLETLGLAKVVRLARAPLDDGQRRRFGLPASTKDMDSLDTRPVDRTIAAQTVLDAHENLVSLTPDNVPRFQDVLTYLKDHVGGDVGASEDGAA